MKNATQPARRGPVSGFTRTHSYAIVRLAIGALAALLGCTILVRTLGSVGLVWQAFPAYVLGLALLALGIVRWRDYMAARDAR